MRRFHTNRHIKPPFGGIAFDPERRSESADPRDASNGDNAKAGKAALALSCLLDGREQGYLNLMEWVKQVNLTEAPEEALADLLTNLMHYCHREGIEFTDALLDAQGHFKAESGGAQI